MDYIEIIRNSKKYHYFIRSLTKIKLLSSSNSKSEAKRMAINKISLSFNQFIGINLLYIKISFTDPTTDNDLGLIQGYIVLKFKNGNIRSLTNIKNIEIGGHSLVYLSDNYIISHSNNLLVDYETIINTFYEVRERQNKFAPIVINY